MAAPSPDAGTAKDNVWVVAELDGDIVREAARDAAAAGRSSMGRCWIASNRSRALLNSHGMRGAPAHVVVL